MTTWDERMTPRPRREPRLELLEMCWRFVGPSTKPIACGIYRTDAGLEVRAGYSLDDLLHSQLAGEMETARDIAARWKGAMLAKGFTPVST